MESRDRANILHVPREVLGHILSFLDMQDVRAFFRVSHWCRSMRSVLSHLRLPHSQALRASSLSLFSPIRVEGPIVLSTDDPQRTGSSTYSDTLRDEMLFVLSRVRGPVELLLSGSLYFRARNMDPSTSFRYRCTLWLPIQNIENLLSLVLDCVSSRVSQTPEHPITIVMTFGSWNTPGEPYRMPGNGVMGTSWYQGHCRLFIPVMSESIPLSSAFVQGTLREFMIKTPIRSLEYRWYTVRCDRSFKRGAPHRELEKVLLAPDTSSSLVSLSVCLSKNRSLLKHLSNLSLAPNVHTLDFSETTMIPVMTLYSLPVERARNIRTLTGLWYLVIGSEDSWRFVREIIERFASVKEWRLCIQRYTDQRENREPVPLDLESPNVHPFPYHLLRKARRLRDRYSHLSFLFWYDDSGTSRHRCWCCASTLSE